MFTTKNSGAPAATRAAAGRLFAMIDDLIRQGQRAGALPPGDPGRLQLLLAATLQGIAALVTSGRLPAPEAGPLAADAIALFTQANAHPDNNDSASVRP